MADKKQIKSALISVFHKDGLEEILKAFYSILKATNENLKMCHYQIWSDDEIAFIASL